MTVAILAVQDIERFRDEMRALVTTQELGHGDHERIHGEADAVLVELLQALGPFGWEIAEAYDLLVKWAA